MIKVKTTDKHIRCQFAVEKESRGKKFAGIAFVEIDISQLEDMGKRALSSKGRACRDGAVCVKAKGVKVTDAPDPAAGWDFTMPDDTAPEPPPPENLKFPGLISK